MGSEMCIRDSFRSNYLLRSVSNGSFSDHQANSSISNDDVPAPKGNFILLIGTDPRFEASLFNVRLRQLFLRMQSPRGFGTERNGNLPYEASQMTIASIGNPLNLTYKHYHLGNGITTLYQLANGNHS